MVKIDGTVNTFELNKTTICQKSGDSIWFWSASILAKTWRDN